MRCAYKVAAVSGCSFKSFPCTGVQHQQLGLVFGEQSLHGLAVIFLDALQLGIANCFFNKGPYGLTILYQCAVIHSFILLMFQYLNFVFSVVFVAVLFYGFIIAIQ